MASRGLDIPSCNLVINHNIPADEKTFVHRVGRTARAGKSGQAVSLFSAMDIDRVKNIERYVQREMQEVDPDDERVGKLLVQVRMLRTDADLKLKQNNFGERKRKYKNNTKQFQNKKAKNIETK